MHRRAPFLLILLALCFIAWVLLSERGKPSPLSKPGSVASAPAPPDEQQLIRDREFEARQAQARIAELARFEAAGDQRQRAVDASQQTWRELQRQRNDQWSDFIKTRWQTYQALRQSALDAQDRRTPCTLCDGRGSLNLCILCAGDGHCPVCQGTGKSANGGQCSVCWGKGACSLCLGGRHMPCPFCDDGVIYANLPPPSANLPVLGAALSRPSAPKQQLPAPSSSSTQEIVLQKSEASDTASASGPPSRRNRPAYVEQSSGVIEGLVHQKFQFIVFVGLLAIILLLRIWGQSRPLRHLPQ